ncbi:MAG: cytochrome P450 [Pseudomonadota bacterium]
MATNSSSADGATTQFGDPIKDLVQAHFGKAGKNKKGETRDWSLFFFFRVMKHREVAQSLLNTLEIAMPPEAPNGVAADNKQIKKTNQVAGDLSNSAIIGAQLDSVGGYPGLVVESEKDGPPIVGGIPKDPPAALFFDWIKLIVDGTADRFIQSMDETLQSAADPSDPTTQAAIPKEKQRDQPPRNRMAHLVELIDNFLTRAEVSGAAEKEFKAIRENLKPVFNTASDQKIIDATLTIARLMIDELDKVLLSTSNSSDAEANVDLESKAHNAGLAGFCMGEIIRQFAPPLQKRLYERKHRTSRTDDLKKYDGSGGTIVGPTVRSEADQQVHYEKNHPLAKGGAPLPPIDTTPSNITFTFSGLEALQLDENVLASFPEAFREGMAARAERLGDTGPSAPEHWDGELGLRSIHGYFTSSFNFEDVGIQRTESYWKQLRKDIKSFNNRIGERGEALRRILGILFRPFGLEVLHLELGQDPYEVVPSDGNIDDRKIKPLPKRVEHFGFRDGISQPFVDMGLADSPSGGGTPSRNGTWSPVAPGEIYLGAEDEDGQTHLQPANADLRDGGTFLVFRKLEQDVVGFRSFIERQRTNKSDREKLAAQFMGRWRNGAPLVLAPDAALEFGNDSEQIINDFLYEKDDPHGAKCPLSAHVRRSNPRDIGDANDVKRHRILRRSIAYGGPLLPEGSLGDGEERGMLFIAANSRIDLQFEVIQSLWLNRGEFQGQAGLGRCPVTGANTGASDDFFLEAGCGAPVANIPRFVVTKGGDYFFVPSIRALRLIAEGKKFPIEDAALGDLLEPGLGSVKTPELFSKETISDFVKQLTFGPERAICRKIPSSQHNDFGLQSRDMSSAHTNFSHEATDIVAENVVFVGKHRDVTAILQGRSEKNPLSFSVKHYYDTTKRITRGKPFLIGAELGGETEDERKRLSFVLEKAWKQLKENIDPYQVLYRSLNTPLDLAIQRTGKKKQIDLVRDLASEAVYNVLNNLYGTPGPSWLTELAVALPFARQHIGELHPSWLSALRGETPDNPSLTTMQIWCILMFADIVSNAKQQSELKALSLHAGSEMLTHLDLLLAKARGQRTTKPTKLIDAFVMLDRDPKICELYKGDLHAYYADVRILLIELIGAPMSVVPSAFGTFMSAIFESRLDLPTILAILRSVTTDDRFNPSIHQLIYEVLRFQPIPPFFLRRCETDTQLPCNGPVIKKGQWVAALPTAAHLDESAFPMPFTFSLSPYLPGPPRDKNKYLLFGNKGGERECWGGRENIAMPMLTEFVKAAGRLTGLRPVAGAYGEPKDLAGVTIGLWSRFGDVNPKF